ncbi:MAG: glycosyltransferase family 4 protein [Flammeovirgaceae bacterium]
MRIGIDAFWYFDGYSSLKRVTSNLVDYLIRNDPKNEYVLFIDKNAANQIFSFELGSRIKIRYLKVGSLKYNFLVKLFVLPYFSYVDKIDVLVTQYYPSPFSRGRRVVFIYDILYEDFPHLFTRQERYQLWPQKVLSKWAHGIITISQSEKERILKFRYVSRPEKVAVFSLAADKRFKPKSSFLPKKLAEVKLKYNLPDEFLLYVGLLSGRKNLDNLIRALPMIKVDIPLVIIGNGHPTYASNHWALINQLNLKKRVIFTGFVSDDDLPALYALAKVFCFPSFAEGFGLPPLEAISSGIPVAVSNQTSLPEVCGDAGIYFEPDNPNQIAKSIEELVLNESLYQEKSNICNIQAAKFNWDNSAKIILHFLEKI